MMRRNVLILASWALCAASFGQSPDDSTLAAAFRVFDASGAERILADIVDDARGVDVLYIGEEHDDSVGHWVQAQLFELLLADPVVLSLEMFERDVQIVVDEYLSDQITEAHFLKSSRPWPRYKSFYRPLVELAKKQSVPVIAANAPRRYVNRVARLGTGSLDSLGVQARAFLPPLPYPEPDPRYRKKWDRLMEEMASEMPDSLRAHAGEGDTPVFLFDAQALWDAAMAHSVQWALAEYPGALVVHVTGSFHVEGGLGTPYGVRALRPATEDMVVIVRSTDDFGLFDAQAHGSLGDFIIQTDGTFKPGDGSTAY